MNHRRSTCKNFLTTLFFTDFLKVFVYLHIEKIEQIHLAYSLQKEYVSAIMILYKTRGCPRGVMVKAMDSGIVAREFVLQSCYYVHFRAYTIGKGMNPLILPAMG